MSGALPDEDELQAAELALGLEDDPHARRRLAGDPAFAAAHERWLGWAASLFDGPGVAPRPSLWRRIEARLPANDAAPATRGQAGLRRWQMATGASAAVAAALAVAVLARQATPPPQVATRAAIAQAPMVAVLSGADGVVSVSFDPATAHLTVVPEGLQTHGRTPQLWVIGADGRPRSLGVMPATAPGWMPAPPTAAAAIGAGVTIALSLEPSGGSPTGRPTGPVILTGRMTTT